MKLLKKLRINAELSQRDVSDALGYSTPQFISNWERGVSYPPIRALKTLAKLYDVDAEELFAQYKATILGETEADLNRRWKRMKR